MIVAFDVIEGLFCNMHLINATKANSLQAFVEFLLFGGKLTLPPPPPTKIVFLLLNAQYTPDCKINFVFFHVH
jgi:hypothetical protein